MSQQKNLNQIKDFLRAKTSMSVFDDEIRSVSRGEAYYNYNSLDYINLSADERLALDESPDFMKSHQLSCYFDSDTDDTSRKLKKTYTK
jgi:hypothetical protein